VSGFSADWLALREPLDARSRSAGLVVRLRAEAPGGTRRIVDLATGSGANLRYLAPRLGGEQDWLLVDKDGALLETMGARLRTWKVEHGLTLHERGETLTLRGPDLLCRARRMQLDLAGEARCLALDGHWLVTASALLDLVAQQWLDGLLARCRAAGAWLLFALTYDGVTSFWPTLAKDELVNALLNRHQKRDKGFGPALGPRAAWDASAIIRRHGYEVAEALTPWHIGPAEATLQSELVEGWAQAAVEVAPEQADCILGWRRQRHDYIAAGTSRLQVGHRDLLAWPVADGNG
jgi:hypothetical protein